MQFTNSKGEIISTAQFAVQCVGYALATVVGAAVMLGITILAFSM